MGWRDYSLLSVIRQGLSSETKGKPAWRDASPKSRYDAVVIGGGGHGLATAYYLASLHGMRNIAVLERTLIGQGNAGRNTTIVRSNYELPENNYFYEHSLKLWEGLSQELNYNVMFSQRGVLNLFHTPSQLEEDRRRGNQMRLSGIDAELLSQAQVRAFCPWLDFSPKARFPVLGGLLQRRGGSARHDAVVWGFARAADRLGVDIIQNCEVTGFDIRQGKLYGLETSRGRIDTELAGVAVAGRTSQVMAKAGIERLPIESHLLQAFVTEGLKSWFDGVVTYGMGHFYMSQSDKGGMVLGGSLDGYNSYAARGNLPMVSHVMQCGIAMVPSLSRLKILRHWGGIADMSMDGSPIIDRTPIEGLYLNAGWCYGGFKATPASGWCFAHMMATGQPHRLNEKFRLDRFVRGAVIDELGLGATPNAH